MPQSVLLTPVVSRPPHPERGPMLNPSAAMLPSPPGVRGEGGCSADPCGRSTLTATPCSTPRHLNPSWAESGLAVLDATAVLPATPCLAPHGSAPLLTGRVVGAGLPAGSPPKRQQLVPQHIPESNSPSWADVVQNGTPASPPPPAATAVTTAAATAEFLALSESYYYSNCLFDFRVLFTYRILQAAELRSDRKRGRYLFPPPHHTRTSVPQ